MSNPTPAARPWLAYLGLFGGGVVVGMLLLTALDRSRDRQPSSPLGPTQFAPALPLSTPGPASLPATTTASPTAQLTASQTSAVTLTALVVTSAPTPAPSPTRVLTFTPSPSATASPSATSTATRTTTATPTPSTEAQGLAQAMAARVNAARAQSAAVTPAGTSGQTPEQPRPLRVDEQLTRVADAHARDMAARGYLSHVTPEGQTPEDRLRAAGIRYTRVGENIYQGYGEGTVEQAMQWFMADPLHRDGILDPRFTRLGVGVYVAPDKRVYFVQLFSSSPED